MVPKVNFHLFTNKNLKNDLVGPKKLKQIDIPEPFSNFPERDKVQQIWKDFLAIPNLLCSR